MLKTLTNAPTMMVVALVAGILPMQSANANELNNTEATLEQINNYSDETSQSQVTSVSQLSDVSPTDWAYEALRSLVERYGCIVGYPDRTFRGNRALSRYEFAAGLNACMQQIERLVAGGGGADEADLATLRRLVGEFETELATLGARVDNLEGRVGFLEDHQFSTTTKLNGEVIFALVGQNNTGEGEITLSQRTRLAFDTSFTGRDRLRTRLAAGNVPDIGSAVTPNSDMARLNFAQNTDNNIELDKLFYRTPLGERTTLFVGTVIDTDDIHDTYNPYLESGGGGSLARGTRYNPFIFRQVQGSGGAGLKFEFNDRFDFTASYTTGESEIPGSGTGLFNGSFSATAQLGFRPSNNIGIGLAYARSYFADSPNLSGRTGSDFTRRPFGNVATTSDNFGVQGYWRVAPRFNVGGWFGYATADAQDGSGDNADLITWNANFSILDVGKEGSVLTIAGGQPSKVTGGNFTNRAQGDLDSAFILEGQYRYPVTRNISVTPGLYVIFNPNNDNSNNTQYVGVLRTRFTF